MTLRMPLSLALIVLCAGVSASCALSTPPAPTATPSPSPPIATPTPVLPTATPTPLPPTAIPGIVLATKAEEIVGVWVGRSAHAMVQRFDEDGTCRAAGSLRRLQENPSFTCSYRFEGSQLIHTTLEVYDVPPCSDATAVYEVQLLTPERIRFVKVQDTCSPRTETMAQEHDWVSSTPEPTATPTRLTSDLDAGFYRFDLGDFQCACLHDGGSTYSVRDKFATVPIEEAQEALRQHGLPTESVRTPYTFLYVNTGEHQVLVDLGAGQWVPSAGRLFRSMAAAGIEPEQIDTVIITHGHPDHIGGALDYDGNLVCAEADYYMSEEGWSFWFSEETRSLMPSWYVTLARSGLEAMGDRLHLTEGETEVVPGVKLLPAPGHTPGHLMVAVSSGDELLLYIADAATHQLHIEHPDWTSRYDITPEDTIATRRWLMEWAASQEALVIGTHLAPFPSLGTVVEKGDGWQWLPAEISQ